MPVLAAMRNLLTELNGLPSPPPRPYERWAARAGELYVRATSWPRFATLVTVVFVIYALSGFVAVLTTILAAGVALHGHEIGFVSASDLSFLHVATSCCYAVSTTFIVIGLARLRRDRVAAYHWFERSLLVSVLLTRVFLFVESQFGAAAGAFLDIALLLAVRSMIHAEEGHPDEVAHLIDRSGLDPVLATPGR